MVVIAQEGNQLLGIRVRREVYFSLNTFFASGNFVMYVPSIQIIGKIYLKETELHRGSLSHPGSDSG